MTSPHSDLPLGYSCPDDALLVTGFEPPDREARGDYYRRCAALNACASEAMKMISDLQQRAGDQDGTGNEELDELKERFTNAIDFAVQYA